SVGTRTRSWCPSTRGRAHLTSLRALRRQRQGQPAFAGAARTPLGPVPGGKILKRCVVSMEENRKAAEQIGTLGSCLIEGDSEQKVREAKIRRRALAISTIAQLAALVALVLIPLLGRTEKLAFTGIATPMPPYHRPAPQAADETNPREPRPR